MDKGTSPETTRVVFAFLVELDIPDSQVDRVLHEIASVLAASKRIPLPPTPVQSATTTQPTYVQAAVRSPEQQPLTFQRHTAVNIGSKRPSMPPEELPTIVDLPDLVIERPLAGYGPHLFDRNAPQMKPSRYSHITGIPYKMGRGASNIEPEPER